MSGLKWKLQAVVQVGMVQWQWSVWNSTGDWCGYCRSVPQSELRTRSVSAGKAPHHIPSTSKAQTLHMWVKILLPLA